MTRSRIALVAVLVAAIGAFFIFDLGRFLSLDFFKSSNHPVT